MGALLGFLGSYFLNKMGADERAKRETSQKLNSQALEAIVSQATERARQFGENPLDTPELRKTVKSLGGNEEIVDLISGFAKAQAQTPDVISRKGIQAGTLAPTPAPGQEAARAPQQYEEGTTFTGAAPARTTPASPAQVTERIERLSPARQAFAFPTYTAARLVGAQAELPSAQVKELEATAGLKNTQARLAPADLENRQAETRNRLKEIDLNHADRLADINVRLLGAKNDQERNQIAREQLGIDKTYKDEVTKINQEQNRIHQQQIAGAFVDKHATGLTAGQQSRLFRQTIEMLQGRREVLDKDLADLAGINPQGATRLAQLSGAFTKAQDNLGTQSDKVQSALIKKEASPEQLGSFLVSANEQLGQVLSLQAAESRSGIIPTPAVPGDPRQVALQTMKGISKDGRILPLGDIAALDKVTSVSQITGAPKNFDQLFPQGGTGAAGSAGSATSIINRTLQNTRVTPAPQGAVPQGPQPQEGTGSTTTNFTLPEDQASALQLRRAIDKAELLLRGPGGGRGRQAGQERPNEAINALVAAGIPREVAMGAVVDRDLSTLKQLVDFHIQEIRNRPRGRQ